MLWISSVEIWTVCRFAHVPEVHILYFLLFGPRFGGREQSEIGWSGIHRSRARWTLSSAWRVLPDTGFGPRSRPSIGWLLPGTQKVQSAFWPDPGFWCFLMHHPIFCPTQITQFRKYRILLLSAKYCVIGCWGRPPETHMPAHIRPSEVSRIETHPDPRNDPYGR